MTAERPADVAALTEAERDDLCDAVVDYTYRPGNAPARFDQHIAPAVGAILATRTTAARAEGYEAGRAEVTAAVEAIVDEWEQSFGMESMPPHWGVTARIADLRAALAAAPTFTALADRADAARNVVFGAGVEDTDYREFYIDDDAEAVGDDHA